MGIAQSEAGGASQGLNWAMFRGTGRLRNKQRERDWTGKSRRTFAELFDKPQKHKVKKQ
jgi:hypothetical protein